MFDGSSVERTPAEIAASVRIPAKLQAGEAELKRLNTREAEIRSEIAQLNADRGRNSSFGAETDRLIVGLDRERTAILSERGKVRADVVELRRAYAQQVAKALTPSTTAAAQRAHEAATELKAALDDIEAVNAQLERANAPMAFLLPPNLDDLLGRLARLAGR